MRKSTRNLVKPLHVQASMVKKSAATITSCCLDRNSFQVVFRSRSGAGSSPCCFTMLAIVPRATSWPKLASAPWILIAPISILGGHLYHQRLDLVLRTRPAWAPLLAALILLGDQPAMPGQKRCRRHQGSHFMKHAPTQFLASDR